MTRKTQGVHDLAATVLDTLPTPYSEDIIEDVFVAIEADAAHRARYDRLKAALGVEVVNAWLGRYIKQMTAMESGKEVAARRSTLIKGYTRLIA